MVRCGFKNKHQKYTHVKDIRLCAQNWPIISSSIIGVIEEGKEVGGHIWAFNKKEIPHFDNEGYIQC